MKEYLLDKAYYFFPQCLNGFDHAYMEKIEVERLNSCLKSSIDNEYEKWNEIIHNFNIKAENKAIDYTNFLIKQPSLHFKIMIENDDRFIKTFNLYSSLIIPYYYFSEKVFDSMEKCYISMEILNNINSLDNQLVELIFELEKKLEKKQIDEKFLMVKIPNISFEEIHEGNFTVKNAFFNPNDKYL